MLKFKDIELKLQLEKMVIGLEEPILIKGAGKFIAKVDSGNGGYNVIHGEDFVKQGDILNFKTYDADGNERRISKKISDIININIGGGNIQERPVVELNIKFADEEYRKIPFSVTDRSSNKQKVLLSKDFVKNELQALIDVGKTNMTENEPVEVEYVTEAKNANQEKPLKTGIFHPINNIRQGYRNTKDVLKRSAKHPIKAGKTSINNITSFFDKLAHGSDSFNTSLPDDTNEISSTGNAEVDKKIAELSKVIKGDEQLILTRIKQEMPQIAQEVSPNKDPNNKQEINFDIVRILDYTNHGISGTAFEVENSLIGKKLDDLAAEKVKNAQPNETSEDEKFAKPGDIDLKAQPATKVDVLNNSYFDKWMARYDYLTEKERDVTIHRNGKPISIKAYGNTLKIPGPKDKKGEQHFYNVQIPKDHDNSGQSFEQRAQKAYTEFLLRKNAYKQNMLQKINKENQKGKETNNQPLAAQVVPSDEQPKQAEQETNKQSPAASQAASPSAQSTQPNQKNDEAFKKVQAELDKKLQHEMSIKNQFCFYFCGNIPKDNIMQMFNSVNEPYSNKSISFLNNMAFNEGAFNSYASQLKQDLMNTNAYNNGCCGLYALCVGNIGGRRVKLFYDQNVVLPLKK